VQFRHRGHDAEAFEELSLTDALGKNVHETVAGASVLMRASVFLSICSESRVSLCSHPTLFVLQVTKWRTSLRRKAPSSSATRGVTARPSLSAI
jgi:hypothetical protein